MNTEQMMRAFAAWWEEIEIFSMRCERLIGLEKPALAETAFAEGWQAAMRQAVPEGFFLAPNKATEAMLRPFYECPPDELELAYETMRIISGILVAAAQKEGSGE